MIPADHIVFVIDGDFRMREALSDLLSSVGLRAVTFKSAAEYLESPKPDLPACLILDAELPDIDSLDLRKEHVGAHPPPIVFIAGFGDIPRGVRAIKAGAVDFLTKPFSQEHLLKAVHGALGRDRKERLRRAERRELEQRYLKLTPREREVLPLVVSGLLNKQAAAELGISEITLQIHRGKIMQKMGADSLADLVRMAAKLKIPLISLPS